MCTLTPRKLAVLALLLGFSLIAHSAPPLSPQEAQRVKEAQLRYQRQKLGLFIHYVPALTVDPNTNQAVQNIDELANRFDVEQFARDAADFGVEYVIFTVHHAGARMLYPSAVNKRWRDDRRNPGSTHQFNWKTYSEKDVIAPLADALKLRNIDLHLYVHSSDGHDFSPEDQANTGWFECASGHVKWNNYQNELFDELCKRYANRIKGLWFDGLFFHQGADSTRHDNIDQLRFRETLLKYDPALILAANVASIRQKNPAPHWSAVDYRAWEISGVTETYGFMEVNPAATRSNVFTWPGTKEQVALVVGGFWWASHKGNNAKYSAAAMYRYLVLQASVSDSGGLALSAGCFPGTLAEQPNGTLWEGNVRQTLVGLNQLIAPVAESIKNTNASQYFVTEEHQWLDQKGWGVATDSPDGNVCYLHVLRPPQSKTLDVGKPSKGARVMSASILPGGAPISLQGDATHGYTVTLPNNISWSSLDTVIKLVIDPNPLVATSRFVRVAVNTPKPITLTATGANGNPLTYAIVMQPANGTLSGIPPNVIYTPATNYNGPDRFTFKANDGLLDSEAATVRIIGKSDVVAPPVSGYSRWFDASQIDEVNGDRDRVVTWKDLSGNAAHATVPSDRNNSAPIYVANAGTESGLPSVYFARNTNASDSAALSFTRESGIRTIFSVFKGNGPLLTDNVAYHFHRPSNEYATDPLWSNWAVSSNVSGGSTYVNGTLVNGTTTAMPTNLHNGFNLVAVITAGNVQADSFNKDRGDAHAGNQYQAEVIIYNRVLTEAERKSVEAYLMRKWMTPPNNPPVPTARFLRTTANTPKPITLTATDAEGNPLTYSIVTQPANGTLNGTPPNVIYTPAANYNGTDRFTFKANDGLFDSTVATVKMSVTRVPVAPPVSGYSRWFDASQIDGVKGDRVVTWNDLSGNGAHATVTGGMTNAAPVYVANAGTESKLPAVYFAKNSGAANSAALSFARDSAIRTVFSVFKGSGFILTDSSAHHFHRPGDDNATDPMWLSWAVSPSVSGGSTYVNGTLVNGTTTAMPTNLHNGFNLLEVTTTGNVQADSFNKDRGDAHAGNQYHAEVIIYDRVLTEAERLSVEVYLMRKWMTPPPNNFANWAETHARGQRSDQDHDNDGVKNGIEYFMGQSGSSFKAMPIPDATKTVTWTKDPSYSGSWQIQTSSDLKTWTNVTGTDHTTSVSYLLPPGTTTKKFVRLLVTPTP